MPQGSSHRVRGLSRVGRGHAARHRGIVKLVRTLYASFVSAIALAGCGLGNPDLRILPEPTPDGAIDGASTDDRGTFDDLAPPDVGTDRGATPDARDAAVDGPTPVDTTLPLDGDDAGSIDATPADGAETDGGDGGEFDVAAIDASADVPVDAPLDRPMVDAASDAGVDAPAAVDMPRVDVSAVDVPSVDVTTPINWHVTDSDPVSTSWRSGAPDGSFDNLYCGPGQLLVGLTTWSSVYVSGLAPWCARLNPDGTLGMAVRGGQRGGGCCFGSADDLCPANQVVVRFVINAGSVVDRLQAVCAPLSGWLARGETGAALRAHGDSNGGTRYPDDCPAGYMGSGFNLRSGDFNLIERLRNLRLRCSRVSDR
jgi:hypothetical protein